jgi:hypothetical protein
MVDPALAALLGRTTLKVLGRGGSRGEKGCDCDAGDGEVTHGSSLPMFVASPDINQRYHLYVIFISLAIEALSNFFSVALMTSEKWNNNKDLLPFNAPLPSLSAS